MRLVFFLALLSFCSSAPAQSQLGAGAISGSVSDSSGAVIPDAQITVLQAATGLVRQMKSNNAGQFLAPVLPPCIYTVRAAKIGFSTTEEQSLQVTVGATTNVRISLKVGDLAETVAVTASAPIDPSQTDVSSLIDSNQIRDLPINGR